MRRLLLLILFCSSSFHIFSQTTAGSGPTPAQTLRLARATYEQGRLHEVPTQLNDDVVSKMTKQEKVSAYTLLCLSYIYLEEATNADENMLKILETDPYFEPNQAVDPAEFVALWKTFRTWPIFRVGATLGGNFTQPNVSEAIITDNGSAEFKYKFGFQFGASIDYPLTFISKRLTLHGDLLYQIKKFDLSTTYKQGDGDNNETTATETQNWFSFPISFQYAILKNPKKKYQPYVALGVSTDLRLNAGISAERTRDGESPVEQKNYDIKPERESLNLSALAALGVKTRAAGGLLSVEFRYLYGFTEVNSKETAYANTNMYLAHGLPYSIFKINSLSVALTYVQNIFKPKKLIKHK